MYTALTTTLSLDDALDLEEIDRVGRSWRDAAHANIEAKRKHDAAKRRSKGR